MLKKEGKRKVKKIIKNLSKPTKTKVQGENRLKRKVNKAIMAYGTISWNPAFVWLQIPTVGREIGAVSYWKRQ